MSDMTITAEDLDAETDAVLAERAAAERERAKQKAASRIKARRRLAMTAEQEGGQTMADPPAENGDGGDVPAPPAEDDGQGAGDGADTAPEAPPESSEPGA